MSVDFAASRPRPLSESLEQKWIYKENERGLERSLDASSKTKGIFGRATSLMILNDVERIKTHLEILK